jgi:hypothetical protein
MVKVHWIVQTNVYSDDIRPVIEEIKKQGGIVHELKYHPFGTAGASEFEKLVIPSDEACVFLGSTESIDYYQEKLGRQFYTKGNYDCTTYYPHFLPYLLNFTHCFLSWRAFRLAWNPARSLNARYTFVRPNSGKKIFTGRVLDALDKLQHNLDDLEEKNLALRPETLILVAPMSPHDSLYEEYRFFCRADQVLAGSLYKRSGEPVQSRDVPEEVTQAAVAILRGTNWRPDGVFVMDVARSKCGKYFNVIELNSFACSGWYECDPAPVVAEVMEMERTGQGMMNLYHQLHGKKS